MEVKKLLKKKINYLKQIYKVNEETNSFLIEVSLDYYNEVFNGWDPSPIKRRDIDPDLLQFIEQCAFDIPLKYLVELRFYLPKDKYNAKKEELTEAGIKNNFKFIIHFIKRNLAENRKKIFIYIIMSLILLSIGYITKQQVPVDVFTTTFEEIFFIGGWVFLWEAFSIFSFSSQQTRVRLKRYTRFLDTPIHFYYI